MKPKKPVLQKHGFTLIELMMVAAIVGVLASIVMPRYDLTLQRAYQSTSKSNLGSLRSAIALYYSDQEGVYPMQSYLDGIPDTYTPPSPLSSILCPRYIERIPAPILRDRLAYFGLTGLLYDPIAQNYLEQSNPVKDVVMFQNRREVDYAYMRPFGYDQKNGLLFIWNDNYDVNGVSFDSW